MERRTFLAALAAQSVWRNRQAGVKYRRLGRTNFMISPVTFGTQFATPENYDHVELAVEMGLNYLDTAAAYGRGRSEQAVAKVIAGPKRGRVFVNTKASPFLDNRNRLFRKIYDGLPEPEQKRLMGEAQERIRARQADAPDYYCGYFAGQRRQLEASALSNAMSKRYGDRIDRRREYHDLIIRSIDESLKRLGTDHVDIMMCPHGANSREEVTGFPEILEAFETLRKQGKVHHLGVSAHTDPAGVLEGAVAAKLYSVAMIAYNVVNHGYVDQAIDKAAAADLGVIAMKVARPVFPNRDKMDAPLARPEWLERLHREVPGDAKVPLKAYRWVLRNPRVAAVNSDMENAAVVKENLTLLRA